MIFKNRSAAGKKLAEKLKPYLNDPDLIVLALPRGGVPVAYEVARSLNAELDVLLVRKIGVPFNPELALGAIATGGARYINKEILKLSGVSQDQLRDLISSEQMELQHREQLYRAGRQPLSVKGRQIIVIDDGLATGATMISALQSLQEQNPRKIVVAVPVASYEALKLIEAMADEVICLQTPDEFFSVGSWYEYFDQTSDLLVQQLLNEQKTYLESVADHNKSDLDS